MKAYETERERQKERQKEREGDRKRETERERERERASPITQQAFQVHLLATNKGLEVSHIFLFPPYLMLVWSGNRERERPETI